MDLVTAYYLQRRREQIKEKKQQISSLNTGLFTLLRQMNALASFKKDLDALRDDDSRFFKLPPWETNAYDDVKFDTEALSFILTTDNPNVLHHLLIEKERFQQTLSAIKVRSEYQVHTIQPLLEQSNIGSERITWPEAEAVIGKYKLEGLVLGTNHVYEHVDATVQSSKLMLEELHSFAKAQFPNVKFIHAE